MSQTTGKKFFAITVTAFDRFSVPVNCEVVKTFRIERKRLTTYILRRNLEVITDDDRKLIDDLNAPIATPTKQKQRKAKPQPTPQATTQPTTPQPKPQATTPQATTPQPKPQPKPQAKPQPTPQITAPQTANTFLTKPISSNPELTEPIVTALGSAVELYTVTHSVQKGTQGSGAFPIDVFTIFNKEGEAVCKGPLSQCKTWAKIQAKRHGTIATPQATTPQAEIPTSGVFIHPEEKAQGLTDIQRSLERLLERS
jgi:hypothetical protein